MQAWQTAIQLLQLHLLELDPARKQPTASTSDLLSRTGSNGEQLRHSKPSRALITQMLQAEVRTYVASLMLFHQHPLHPLNNPSIGPRGRKRLVSGTLVASRTNPAHMHVQFTHCETPLVKG